MDNEINFKGWEIPEIYAWLFSDEKGKRLTIELVNLRLNKEASEEIKNG